MVEYGSRLAGTVGVVNGLQENKRVGPAGAVLAMTPFTVIIGALLALLPAGACALEVHGPRQVLVLSYHQCGSSIVTRIVNLLGAHVGENKDLLLSPKNPLKYWESQALIDANDW